MEFITRLLMVNNHDAILVIVDQFSKYVTFLPMSMDCKAEEVVDLFL